MPVNVSNSSMCGLSFDPKFSRCRQFAELDQECKDHVTQGDGALTK